MAERVDRIQADEPTPPAPVQRAEPTPPVEPRMSIHEFAQLHVRDHPAPLVYVFVHEKERRGELAGQESVWLQELRAMESRPAG